MKEQRFQNKVVVITGASAGIGRATALEFAKEGAKLGLLSRNRARLEKLKQEIQHMGCQVEIFVADVADAKAVEDAAAFFEERLGLIDIWVNNAMASVFSPIKQMEAEEFKRVMEVTYLGQVHGTLSALRRMLPRDEGVIVQVGSALAYRGIPLQSAYCAAKHAVQGFHDSLQTELIHDQSNVKVTMVQLPAFNTPQFDWVKSRLARKAQPVPPIYEPEIAAKAILWSAEHPKREVIVGWPTFQAIFADKFFPGLLDRYLAKTGYKGQQTDEPENMFRRNNLWETVEGEFGSHGRFDQEARSRITPVWLTTHFQGILGLIFIALIAKLFLSRRYDK